MDFIDEQEEAAGFFDRCKEILHKKAMDYSQKDNCFSNFEFMARSVDIPVYKTFLLFLSVKLARLNELLSSNKQPKNESVQDSLIDIVNYACLLSIYLKEKES